MRPTQPKHFERSYQDNAILQKGFNAQIIQDLVDYILRVCPWAKKHPIKVLDLCCGDGGVTTAIFKQLIIAGILIEAVVGSDVSPDQIAVATEQYSKIDPRLLFECQDATLMTDRNKYDVIICLFGLHWIQNIEKMALIINQALAADGKLVYFVPLEKERLFEKRKLLVESDKWAQHFVNFSFVHDKNFVKM